MKEKKKFFAKFWDCRAGNGAGKERKGGKLGGKKESAIRISKNLRQAFSKPYSQFELFKRCFY